MAFNTDNLTEITPVESASLEIDIELRDLWVELDQMRETWDEQEMAVAANLMRVAFGRGRELGKTEGHEVGRRKGFDEGYEAAHAENSSF